MQNRNFNNTIETIQRILFLLALVVVPLSIIPFPWDLTEYSMSLVLSLFAIPILALEFVKVILSGSISYPKGKIDTAIMFLMIAFSVSTVFSKSPVTSFMGFDSRLGDGLIGLLTLFVFTYSARNFIRGIEGIIYALMFLLIGITLGSIISIFSFWGMNPLSFIPAFKELFTTGLPLYSSARISLIIFSTGILFSTGLLIYAFRKYNLALVITTIVTFLVNLTALLLYSIVQGYEQVILLIAVMGALLVMPFFRRKPLNKVFVITMIVTLVTLIVGFLVLRIPQFKDLAIRDSSNLITQVTIAPEVSWKIGTNAVSESFWNGIVGYGQDTFSIAYNLYRPLTDEILVLNNTNFTFPSNQVLNVFISLGIVGLLAFAYLAVKMFLHLIQDWKEREYLEAEDFFALMLDLLSLYIIISSIFIYYSFFVYLLLFFCITLSVILRHIKKEEKGEMFVFSLGMFVHRPKEGLNNTALVAVIIVALPILWLYTQSFKYLSAGFKVLEAERITSEGRVLNDKDKLSEEDKESLIVKASNLYGEAINQAPKNEVFHRRASLIITQYVELLAQKYNKTDIESEKKMIFEDITTYVEIAVEESKLSTDIAPRVYSNWGTRANVYSKLVGLGLKSYSKTALSTMQQAASLNPLNYELYYNAAQLYVINNDNDSALRTLNQVFTINPEHIPSNVLAGELSLNDKDYKQADRYFNKAKEIMDKYGENDSELYKYVVKKLTEITPQLPKETEQSDKSAENGDKIEDQTQKSSQD